MPIDKSKILKLLQIFNLNISQEYMLNTSEHNLNNLLEFYKEIVPDWKQTYNKFNKRINTSKDKSFDELLGAQLSEEVSIDSLKVSENAKEGKNSREILIDDIMQRGRIVHLSNKIGHELEHLYRATLKEYIRINEIELPNNNRDFNKVLSLMKKAYSPTLDSAKKEVAKEELKNFGFKDEDFKENEKLDDCNFEEFIIGFNNAMKIKDMEIENINLIIKQNKIKEVSYGYKEDTTAKKGSLFVMDVLNFGQFSVHIKSSDLIEQLKSSPYQMPVYSIETDLLVDYKSEAAREFYDNAISNNSFDEKLGITDKTIDKEKERRRLIEQIRNLDMPKGKKHELGVRYGLGRKQLKRIEAEGEDRE